MGLAEEVKATYDRLAEKISLFPYKCCMLAARAMHSLGYEIIEGSVELDNYCGSGEDYRIPHYWNYDPKSKSYFDITASQFNPMLKGSPLPEIAVWREDELTSMYKIFKRDISPYEMY